jgi:hypothetical protein
LPLLLIIDGIILSAKQLPVSTSQHETCSNTHRDIVTSQLKQHKAIEQILELIGRETHCLIKDDDSKKYTGTHDKLRVSEPLICHVFTAAFSRGCDFSAHPQTL